MELNKIILTEEYLKCMCNFKLETERKTRFNNSQKSFKQLPKETQLRIKDSRPDDINEKKDLYYVYPQHSQLFKITVDVSLEDLCRFAEDSLVISKRGEFKRMKNGDTVIAKSKIVEFKVSDIKRQDSNKVTKSKVKGTVDLVKQIQGMKKQEFNSFIADKPDDVKLELTALWALIGNK